MKHEFVTIHEAEMAVSRCLIALVLCIGLVAPVSGQTLAEKPEPEGGDPSGSWTADGIPLGVYV